MTIESYLAVVDETLRSFGPLVLSWNLRRELDTNLQRGFIKGRIEFADGSKLDFSEQLPVERRKYRLHYMDSEDRLIVRWDSAPHHKDLNTYPFHKHTPGGIEAHAAMTMLEALEFISLILDV